MWGAIIGDLAGSMYEFQQYKEISNIYNIKDIINNQSFYSDDSILTIAILDAILNKENYYDKLKQYGNKYIDYLPKYNPYFKTSFSPNFIKWIKGNYIGKSIGNGAMMRISPVGYLFDTEEDVINNAKLATVPSHDSEEAIYCSKIIALIIFYARYGFTKEEIIDKLNLCIKYQPFTKFNYTCGDTIANCLYAIFTSNSFEESIKKIISYGGDTDTNACIVGSVSEALYGIDNKLTEMAIPKIPNKFTKILNKGYSKITKF